MPRNPQQKRLADSESDDDDLDEYIAIIAATVAQFYYDQHIDKTPLRDSPYLGERYTRAVLACSNPTRVLEICRMKRETFLLLCQQLRRLYQLNESELVSVEQQVMMFMHVVAVNPKIRATAEKFQRSTETVSRYFNNVLDALADYSNSLITLPDTEYTPSFIARNDRFYPYFKNCIGAMDGTHIPAHCVGDNQAFRNRKGFLSQNVLAACTFDMEFCYVLAGWEGSASDQGILEHALDTSFVIPNGRYYLGDAGFGLWSKVLVPYRGVRYHLKEWNKAGLKPESAKELFNLRHSSLRNVIERIFGVMKRRFPILNTPPEYSFVNQVKLVKALCGLHNFIKRNQEEDSFFMFEETESNVDDNQRYTGAPVHNGVTVAQREEGSKMRDEIAEEMWRDFCNGRNR